MYLYKKNMKKIIKIKENRLIHIIMEIIKEQSFNKSDSLVDSILDKINKYGFENLTFDEKKYLNQYSKGYIDLDLKNWIESDKENTFDIDGNKLLYDEFDWDEDIFRNSNKLKRIISKSLGKKPFTNDPDWGGAYVWNIESDNNFEGTFFYLGDDELLILKRNTINDQYEDEVIYEITNPKNLYKALSKIKK
jgi:hypothetical protein